MRGRVASNVAQGFSPAIPAALKGCATSERDHFKVAQGFSPAIVAALKAAPLRSATTSKWRRASALRNGLSEFLERVSI
jgi:hypothetical protein